VIQTLPFYAGCIVPAASYHIQLLRQIPQHPRMEESKIKGECHSAGSAAAEGARWMEGRKTVCKEACEWYAGSSFTRIFTKEVISSAGSSLNFIHNQLAQDL